MKQLLISKIILAILIAPALLLLATQPVSAHSCVNAGLALNFLYSDIVFLGTIIEHNSDERYLVIERPGNQTVFKGTIEDKTITVSRQFGTAERTPPVGQTTLIFLSYEDDGQLSMPDCSGSIAFTEEMLLEKYGISNHSTAYSELFSLGKQAEIDAEVVKISEQLAEQIEENRRLSSWTNNTPALIAIVLASIALIANGVLLRKQKHNKN